MSVFVSPSVSLFVTSWYCFKISQPGARFTDNVLRFYHMIYAVTKVMMC